IPDDVRVVGDKCLYDVGLFGRQAYQGLDLKHLGVRCYHLASELLEHLADDRRLRDYFRQNRLAPMPIEEEVVFLRQCATRFTIYASLLRGLRIFEPEDAAAATGSAAGAPNVTPAAPPPPIPAPPHSIEEALGAAGLEASETSAITDSQPAVDPSRKAADVDGADKLPRQDLLSLYERLLLSSNLDVPRLPDQLHLA